MRENAGVLAAAATDNHRAGASQGQHAHRQDAHIHGQVVLGWVLGWVPVAGMASVAPWAPHTEHT